MKLQMDKETARHFDEHGPLNAKELEIVFIKSCQDQKRLQARVARLRIWDKILSWFRLPRLKKR